MAAILCHSTWQWRRERDSNLGSVLILKNLRAFHTFQNRQIPSIAWEEVQNGYSGSCSQEACVNGPPSLAAVANGRRRTLRSSSRFPNGSRGATLNDMNYSDRIVRDPRIVNGEPVLKGTRVTLKTVLASLAEGATTAEILADFPTLSEEDVRAAIAFAAASAQEDLPLAEIPIKR